jgi:flagellar hook-associated protein 1 FlgK
MADAVDRINNLSCNSSKLPMTIVRGSGSATDLTESLDTRDKIMKPLSEELGIRAVTRSNNDIALYTDSGVTLLDRFHAALQDHATMTAGVSGNAAYIDVDVKVLPAPWRSGRKSV